MHTLPKKVYNTNFSTTKMQTVRKSGWETTYDIFLAVSSSFQGDFHFPNNCLYYFLCLCPSWETNDYDTFLGVLSSFQENWFLVIRQLCKRDGFNPIGTKVTEQKSEWALMDLQFKMGG